MIDIRLITKESSKIMFWKIFCELKGIAKIYGIPYNPLNQGAVKVSNKTLQNFLTIAKDHKEKK